MSRPRPTPERIAEIREWVTQTVPDSIQEAHVLDIARDVLVDLDSRNGAPRGASPRAATSVGARSGLGCA